jgi:uncharacterized damage-inducible protein DinB
MKRWLLASALLALLAVPALADHHEAAPAATAYKGDVMFWIKDAETKLVQLAEAIPENKYSWKPAKDTRTVSEVFMHVAGGNYGLAMMAGFMPPAAAGIKGPDDAMAFDKSKTKKAEVVQALKESFAHMQGAFAAASDESLETPADLMGMKTTGRGIHVLLLAHAHEHLGQAIAYARSVGVAPPWTAVQNAAMEKRMQEMKAKTAGKE